MRKGVFWLGMIGLCLPTPSVVQAQKDMTLEIAPRWGTMWLLTRWRTICWIDQRNNPGKNQAVVV